MFNCATIAKDPVIYTALLHFDGTDGSTTFEDEFNTDWSIASNAAIRTANAKFGSSSFGRLGQFSSATIFKQGLPVPGTGDYTIDFWLYLQNAPTDAGSRVLVSGFIGTGIVYGGVTPPDRLRFPTSSGTAFSPTGLTTGVWQHIALERFNGTVYLYLNGTQGTSSVDTTNRIGNQLNLTCPEANANSAYVDEFRYIYNKAAYGGVNFTPNTQPYRP